MFFNKPIHDVTFEDVVAFCQRGVPEGKQLDYKFFLPKDREKFAKTMASFANALGGTVIVGVQDDRNDKPKPPFDGIAYHEKMRNCIEDIIQTYIDPIVFVDVNICVNPKGDRMFILVDIPQSNLTPHLVGKLKRAYIRTGQSSRPEIIVHPERLPWLLNNRRKSERLRHILYDKAESHFENYLKTKNIALADKAVSTLSLMPLYPQEALVDYKQLPQLAHACAPKGAPEADLPPLQPVQDGVIILSNQKELHAITEFNAYGLVMDKRTVAEEAIFNGHPSQTLTLQDVALTLVRFLTTAQAYLDKCGFGGPLNFRFKLSGTRGLRSLNGKNQATVLEDYIRLDRTFTLSELQARFALLAVEILHEAAWGLGLQPDEKDLSALVQELIHKRA